MGFRSYRIYDNAGNVTENIDQSYDNRTGLWNVNYGAKTDFTYTPNGFLETATYKNWNVISNSYITSTKDSFSVNANGVPNGYVTSKWVINKFVPTSKTDSLVIQNYRSPIINSGELLYSKIATRFQNAWLDSAKTISSYDTNGSVESTTFLNLGSGWQPYEKYTETYSAKKFWTGYSQSYYNDSSRTFNLESGGIITPTYAANGIDITAVLNEYWSNGRWNNSERFVYFNHQQFVVGLPKTKLGTLEIYPNPATSQINILGAETEGNIIIRNAIGQVVKQEGLSGNQPVSLQGLAKGVYYISISTVQSKPSRLVIE
jgi:hypothetical protein